jgi:hypothetical protein
MNCAVHPEIDATGYCRNCGKAMCPGCTREVRGALYCEGCLANMVTRPQPVAGGPNPAAALLLGFIPGLGAVYNGEYVKAIIHLAIWGGLFAMGLSDSAGEATPIIWVIFGIFPLYMAIDSFRTAKLRRAGVSAAPADMFTDIAAGTPGAAASSNRPLGAVILIGLGVLFLLMNFGVLEGEWFRRGWPLILIGVGGWLIWKRTQGK